MAVVEVTCSKCGFSKAGEYCRIFKNGTKHGLYRCLSCGEHIMIGGAWIPHIQLKDDIDTLPLDSDGIGEYYKDVL